MIEFTRARGVFHVYASRQYTACEKSRYEKIRNHETVIASSRLLVKREGARRVGVAEYDCFIKNQDAAPHWRRRNVSNYTSPRHALHGGENPHAAIAKHSAHEYIIKTWNETQS